MPKRGRDDTPYITTYPIPAYNYRLSGCADQLQAQQRLPPYPLHSGTNPNLALWAEDDGIGAKCHSAGCSYGEIATAIRAAYGISIDHSSRQGEPRGTSFPIKRKPTPARRVEDLRPYALELWHSSISFPQSPTHPGRRWLAARQLWRPELPLPAAVRWIDAKHLIMSNPPGDNQSRAARRMLRHQWQPSSKTARAIEVAVAKLLCDPKQAELAKQQMEKPQT